MGRKSIWIQAGLVISLLAVAWPVRAQITALRIGRGVIVYTNDDAPNRPATEGRRPFPTPNHPTKRSRFEPLVSRMAAQHHLDPRFVEAVIRVESNWNPRAISSKGAAGLMQLTPGTASEMGVRDALNPSDNVRAGTAYLAKLVGRFGGDMRKALAAYYAGPGAVNQPGVAPVPPVATPYIRRVLNVYFQAGPAPPSAETGSERIYETVNGEGRLVYTNQ